MSTFAVFGMTRAAALEMARKRTPNWIGHQQIPQEEWECRVQSAVDHLMHGTQVKQLSDTYDAPQFAQEFIAITMRTQQCRDLHIRAKTVAKDGAGEEIYAARGKRAKREWVEWREAA